MPNEHKLNYMRSSEFQVAVSSKRIVQAITEIALYFLPISNRVMSRDYCISLVSCRGKHIFFSETDSSTSPGKLQQ